ncbi:MAG: DUF2085 domain-containing protein [Anaerolineales bacterium]|nr:DUF2085 domain-containing protein [Anaerolineales bacterium]
MPVQDTHPEGSKKSANLFQRLKPGRRTSRWMLMVCAVLLLAAWLLNTPPGLEGKADAVGYALCHQISSRSFQINGQPVSLCARCTGMYVGIFVGLAYQLILGRRRAEWPDREKLIVLGIFLLGFAVDGANSASKLYFGQGLLYTPNNTLRLITGTGMGLGMAAMILPTLNQTIWREYDPRPYLQTWAQFGGFVLSGAVSAALILTEIPFLLQAFTYIGVIGIIVILAMLYIMILMIIFNRENRCIHWVDTLNWVLVGLILALIHIGAIDLARYFLTGTWEGFHI